MTLDPYDIIINPYVTEKTMNRLDNENAVDFIVHMDATKPKIKWAVEEMFETEVSRVRTMITAQGEKRAIVTFPPSVQAEDIAMRVGIF